MAFILAPFSMRRVAWVCLVPCIVKEGLPIKLAYFLHNLLTSSGQRGPPFIPGNTRLLLIQFMVLILRLSMTVLCFISSWHVSVSMAIIRFEDVVLVVLDITAVDPILSAVYEMDIVDFLKSISDHRNPNNSDRRIPVANANLNSA